MQKPFLRSEKRDSGWISDELDVRREKRNGEGIVGSKELGHTALQCLREKEKLCKIVNQKQFYFSYASVENERHVNVI